MSRLLIIEDDAETADEVRQYLGARGHAVEWCMTGSDGLAAASNAAADLLIVDRLLPEMDGLAVIGAVRSMGIATPAIVLSAVGDPDQRLAGLKAQGDDYLGKPFSLAELEARVEALLRRKVVGDETVLQIGSLALDLVRRVASRGDRDVPLLPREFMLLEYMMRRAGQTVTRSMLFGDVWGYRFPPNTNLIDVHVGKLRRKLHGPGETEMLFNVKASVSFWTSRKPDAVSLDPEGPSDFAPPSGARLPERATTSSLAAYRIASTVVGRWSNCNRR